MPGMLSSLKSKDYAAQLALLAFHEGFLDGAQLRRCVRAWVEQTDSSLEEILDRELDADEEVIANLKLKLAKFHPNHAIATPHFLVDAQQSDELPVDAQTSVHNAVAANSPDASRDAQRRGDEELPQKSKRNKSRTSRGDGFDYYDSVHEKFTRDERLMPYLIQSAFAYRRKLAMDLRRFWRSTKSLFHNMTEWFAQNRRNAILTGVGILLFVPACYFLSQFISPNRSRPHQLSSQGSPLTTSNQALETEKTLDVSSLGFDEFDQPLGGDDLAKEVIGSQTTSTRSARSAEQGSGGSEGILPAANDLGQQAAVSTDVDANVATDHDATSNLDSSGGAQPDSDLDVVKEPVPEPTTKQLLEEELQRGVDLLDRRQFGRASKILKNARLTHADSKELSQMLAVALLASRAVDEAGELLVEAQFADAEDPVWQALFTCWLLQSTEASRASVKGELLTLVSLRPPTDITKRCVAWIDARDGRHREAGPNLLPDPMFSERSFADALFFCVALNGVGQRELAREQLEYAKTSYAAVDKDIRQSAEPKSAAMYAIRFVSTTVNSTLNSIDAKLP